jgi:hypothetical protein
LPVTCSIISICFHVFWSCTKLIEIPLRPKRPVRPIHPNHRERKRKKAKVSYSILYTISKNKIKTN